MTDKTTFDLPYFDVITKQLAEGGGSSVLETMVGRNVHWGYWEEPSTAKMTAEDFREASDNLTRKLLKWADIQSGQRILDVGCGFGGTVALINETYSGISTTGLNIDARQIARANEEVKPHVRPGNAIDFVVGDACNLPFPDASFDTVLAVECIFHFPSRTRFFQHAHRVLKPGGKLVLCDFVARPLLLPLIGLIYLMNRKQIEKVYGSGNKLGFLKHYARLADRSGFKQLGVEDITAGTMPTYAVIRKFADNVGFDGNDFVRAQAICEFGSKLGAIRYDILAFQK